MATANVRPLDTGDHTRLQAGTFIQPCAGVPSSYYCAGLPCGVDRQGNSISLAEGSNTGSTTSTRSVCINSVSSTQGNRGLAPSVQSQTTQPSYCVSTFQDGGPSSCQVPASARRFHGNVRSEGCIFHGSDFHWSPQISPVHLESNDVRICSPTVWNCKCPSGLHKDIEASGLSASSPRDSLCYLHRRPPYPGQILGDLSRQCHNSDFSHSEFGFPHQLGKVEVGTKSADSVSGDGNQHTRYDNQLTSREGGQTSARLSGVVIKEICHCPLSLQGVRSYDSSSRSSYSGSTSLPGSSKGPVGCPSPDRVVRRTGSSLTGNEGGVGLVGGVSRCVERQVSSPTETQSYYSDGLVQQRLGCSLRTQLGAGTVEPGRTESPHQSVGNVGSQQRSGTSGESSNRCVCGSSVRQYLSSDLHQLSRGNSVLAPEQVGVQTVVVVSEAQYPTHCSVSSRETQSGSRLSVSKVQRQLGMVPKVCNTSNSTSTVTVDTRGGSVCSSSECTVSSLRLLETGPTGMADRRILHPVEQTGKLCISSILSHPQSPSQNSPGQGSPYSDSASMDNSTLVPGFAIASGTGSGIASTTPRSSSRSVVRAASSTRKPDVASRVAAIRSTLRARGISERVSRVILQSVRCGTAKQYNSAWRRWDRWCKRQKEDPISAPIPVVLEFLADQLDRKLQYRTINVYRSAISSVHLPVEGYRLGNHPLVTQFMRGVYISRPPQPKYTLVWDVRQVLELLRRWSPAKELSLKKLTFKTVMLVALCTASRCSDLASLQVESVSLSKGSAVLFPARLSKTDRPAKKRKLFVLPAFKKDRRLCVVYYLVSYLRRVELVRKHKQVLFVSFMTGKPVLSATIARWIRWVLQEAGIDKSFSAHSTRAAVTSALHFKGASLQQILCLANWSSARTFAKHYQCEMVSSISPVLDTLATD